MTLRDLEEYTALISNIQHYENEIQETTARRDRLLDMVSSKEIINAIQDNYRQLESLLLHAIADRRTTLKEIERVVESFEGTEGQLLKLRVYQGLDWDEIAESMNYSMSNTHNYRTRVVKRLMESG
jgi:DNA-directed RNA polymerase specialized sigma24 family protein